MAQPLQKPVQCACAAVAAVLLSFNLYAKKPLTGADFSKAAPNDVKAPVVLWLENHYAGSGRDELARRMNGLKNTGHGALVLERLNGIAAYSDSSNAYVLQPSDTLSEWLNSTLLELSKEEGASYESNSHARLFFGARQCGMKIAGLWQDAGLGIDADYKLRVQDSAYAERIARIALEGSGKIDGLFGARHIRIKSLLSAKGVEAAAILLLEPAESMAEEEKRDGSAADERFVDSVEKPILKLGLAPGFYKAPAGFYSDYLLVIDRRAPRPPMPPVARPKFYNYMRNEK